MKRAFLFLLMCLALPLLLSAQVLMLFGGLNHDVYLGSLNTNRYDSNSIWNQYGTYGSRYSSTSIWNEYGTYGSEYSSYSPWNQYASTPPVIVDKDGKFYGYFSKNEYISKRTTIDWIVWILDNSEIIKEDTSKGYESIF